MGLSAVPALFLLTPLREGRLDLPDGGSVRLQFLLTPLREGRPRAGKSVRCMPYFYSRPCGRGDVIYARYSSAGQNISTHAPAGGATLFRGRCAASRTGFLLTPLREGRRTAPSLCSSPPLYFYSRPCGRGDVLHHRKQDLGSISTHAPAGGATRQCRLRHLGRTISTHAPAGGATAIFHKSVMRFCGKLPKDDTVLCLASFGFPRRDPKAVYLA